MRWNGTAALFVAAWAVAALPPTAAHAQASATLSGRVIDAGSGEPVPDATITLEPAAPGLILEVTAAAPLMTVRTQVTGASGLYRFTDVATGSYRLRIERIGYRAATIDVEVRRAAETGVSVGLELQPVSLEPVNARDRAAPVFQRASNLAGELDAARISAELDRQERYLSSDTRVLTFADVMDGVTLGEGDVFRALQRFAGVGTRDDYTAELWTRGAPWTQTRVTFDGVPLFNPVHAVGVLSAFTPEVLGAVHFHPGVRPPSMGEGAAGLVELRSRSGAGDGSPRGVADVSTASSKLVLEQRAGERTGWVIGARRSHLDVLSGGIDWMGLDTLDLPFVFHDVAARVDAGAGRVSLEASGLHEEDRLEGDVPGVLEETRARWGNTAGRATVRVALGRVELSQTIGASRFDARTDERVVRTRDSAPSWTEPASHNRIDHLRIAGELAPAAAGPGAWSAGYDIAVQSVDYDGPFPRYHAVRPDTTLRLHYARSLTVAALWGAARAGAGRRITLDAGLRAETGDAVANSALLRLSPRLALRVRIDESQSLSVSAGRTWQHTQSIALAGPSIHPAFHATHFWLWSDTRTPAIRADIVNVGSERWLGGGWLAGANAYRRTSEGLTLPDPSPGRLGRRPLFVRGSGSAHGLELGLRRIGASWSTALGYTYGRSEVEVAGRTYAASADRRHVVDAMAAVRVWRGLRASAAYTAMTGAPFTRAYSRSPDDCSSFGFGCENPTGSWVDEHNAERTPGYAALDMSLQWAQRAGPVELSAYVQVRNVLARDNASTYAGSGPIGRVMTPDGWRIIWEDRFERGLPRVPMLGLRMSF